MFKLTKQLDLSAIIDYSTVVAVACSPLSRANHIFLQRCTQSIRNFNLMYFDALNVLDSKVCNVTYQRYV